jgi:hypothetical protein
MVRPGTVPTYPFSTTVRLSQSTYRLIVGLNSSFSNFLSTKISQSVRSPWLPVHGSGANYKKKEKEKGRKKRKRKEKGRRKKRKRKRKKKKGRTNLVLT